MTVPCFGSFNRLWLSQTNIMGPKILTPYFFHEILYVFSKIQNINISSLQQLKIFLKAHIFQSRIKQQIIQNISNLISIFLIILSAFHHHHLYHIYQPFIIIIFIIIISLSLSSSLPSLSAFHYHHPCHHYQLFILSFLSSFYVLHRSNHWHGFQLYVHLTADAPKFCI